MVPTSTVVVTAATGSFHWLCRRCWHRLLLLLPFLDYLLHDSRLP
jgi:hypothetical protein